LIVSVGLIVVLREVLKLAAAALTNNGGGEIHQSALGAFYAFHYYRKV
jgi:hypothetical protein